MTLNIPFLDDAGGISLLRFIYSMAEAKKASKEIINDLETCTGKFVKRLRSDNGTVFLSNEFQNWLKWKGVFQEISAPYSPESKGKTK